MNRLALVVALLLLHGVAYAFPSGCLHQGRVRRK